VKSRTRQSRRLYRTFGDTASGRLQFTSWQPLAAIDRKRLRERVICGARASQIKTDAAWRAPQASQRAAGGADGELFEINGRPSNRKRSAAGNRLNIILGPVVYRSRKHSHARAYVPPNYSNADRRRPNLANAPDVQHLCGGSGPQGRAARFPESNQRKTFYELRRGHR
jgi:hypothetical protein